jgi:hypothetical protein
MTTPGTAHGAVQRAVDAQRAVRLDVADDSELGVEHE